MMPQACICTACTNGCRLYFINTSSSESSTKQFLIKGNECEKGLTLAKSKYKYLDIISNYEPISNNQIEAVLDQYSIKDWKLKENQFLQGSPERSLQRVLIDGDTDSYIIEKIRPEQLSSRTTIAEILEHMHALKIPSLHYIKNNSGHWVTKTAEAYWMISPYFQGTKLKRSCFWKDSEYGTQLAAFITAIRQLPLHQHTPNLPAFNISQYAEKLLKDVSNNRPDVFERLHPIHKKIRHVLNIELPQVFSHGDPHPMNIIWNGNQIKAVIDWEFCGFKDSLYDIALICGCVGLEHEDALFTGLVPSFLNRLIDQGTISRGDLLIFPEYLVCQRFAWLSEWLRRDDEEMLQAELNYMEYILENRKRLLGL